jgi:hypothetical protein
MRDEGMGFLNRIFEIVFVAAVTLLIITVFTNTVYARQPDSGIDTAGMVKQVAEKIGDPVSIAR